MNYTGKTNKDQRRNDLLKSIRKELVKQSKTGFKTILSYPEIKRYHLGLKHITTSNKAICEALNIPVEAGTRYKAELEETLKLVASTDKFQCHYTKEYVQFLSTNPLEFERLTKLKTNQLKMF
jgi:hypothetical protein